MYLGNPQFDRSLLTVDINGAQPKNKHAYMNRLLPNQLRFEDHLKMQTQVQPQDLKFGRRRYQHDFHHFCNLVVPQGEVHFEKTQKKHYLRDEGEIKQFHALENHFDLPQYYHIPNEDNQWLIECSLQMTSKVHKAVRNQEIAQRIRYQQQEMRMRRNQDFYENSFIQEPTYYPVEKKQKSYSVQQSPNPKYDYMNTPPKLPPLQQMKFDPISNKLQLRPLERNYIQSDFKRTLELLNVQGQ